MMYVLFLRQVNTILKVPQSARELTAASWARDLALTLPRCESLLARLAEEGNNTELKTMQSIGNKMKGAMRSVWKGAANDVFDVG